MQQLLKPEEVPRGLGGVWRFERIGKFLERCIPKQREQHQKQGQDLHRHRAAK